MERKNAKKTQHTGVPECTKGNSSGAQKELMFWLRLKGIPTGDRSNVKELLAMYREWLGLPEATRDKAFALAIALVRYDPAGFLRILAKGAPEI